MKFDKIFYITLLSLTNKKKAFNHLKAYLRIEILFEFFWLIAGQLTTLIVGVAVTKYLTNLGSISYGKYTLILSIINLLNLLLYGPAEQSFAKYYFNFNKYGLQKQFFVSFQRFLFGSFILFFFTTIFNYIINNNLFIITLFIFFTTINYPLISLLNIVRQRRFNSIIQIIERLLVIIFLTIFFRFFDFQLTTAIVSLTIPLILSSVFRFLKLYDFFSKSDFDNSSKILESNKLNKEMMKFAYPFIIWGIAGWLQLNSEKWIIESFLDSSILGIYGLMSLVSNLLIAVPYGVLIQFFTPIIYEKFSDINNRPLLNKGKSLINFFIYLIIIIVIISVVVTTILGKQIIFLLGNAGFVKYWYLLPFIALANGLYHIGQALTVFGLSLNVPQKYLIPKIFIGILSVILNIFLILTLGLVGIIISMMFIGFIYLFMILFINKNIFLATLPKVAN